MAQKGQSFTKAKVSSEPLDLVAGGAPFETVIFTPSSPLSPGFSSALDLSSPPGASDSLASASRRPAARPSRRRSTPGASREGAAAEDGVASTGAPPTATSN